MKTIVTLNKCFTNKIHKIVIRFINSVKDENIFAGTFQHSVVHMYIEIMVFLSQTGIKVDHIAKKGSVMTILKGVDIAVEIDAARGEVHRDLITVTENGMRPQNFGTLQPHRISQSKVGNHMYYTHYCYPRLFRNI